ncbi:hypothetical protein Pmani_010711 [Petrolisthes manimaculis]|uniref:CUB domain-containing protein n=1 Tax=Petrolisthes manimaculis TaxID=1843537 RepID=A0AAE1Q186_9EUCA|nr:hypothetical protein Pmani_010711 [Petrolisthes manimaculis]
MKVDKCVLVLVVVVVVVLMMLHDANTTKPNRNIRRTVQKKKVKPFGELSELAKEIQQCGPRRVVQTDGSVENITTPCEPKNIKPIIVNRKVGKAECGNIYEMTAGTKLRAKMVGKPQRCEMVINAAEGAELEVNCKKFKLTTTSCKKEALFLADGTDILGTFCNTNKPDMVKGTDMVLAYLRDRKKKYKGSKITCFIQAVAASGGGSGRGGGGGGGGRSKSAQAMPSLS